MKLNPLSEGAAAPRAWPTFDPEPAALLLVDFIGSKMAGRPIYKRLSDRYADATQIPGWNYSGSTSNGLPRYAETKAGKLVPFAANVPRITDKGLLVEEARTNLLSVSEQFSDAGWNKSNTTLGQSTRVAPTGALAASTISRAAGVNAYIGRAFSSGAQAVGSTVTASVYAKRETTAARIGLRIQGTYPDRFDAVFDLDTGTLVGAAGSANWSVGSAAIRRVGDYYRLTVTATSAVSGAASFNFGPTDSTRTVQGWEAASSFPSDIVVWGAQAEIGSFETSYIYTFGTTATRAADSAYITGLGSILGQFRTNYVTRSDPSNAVPGTPGTMPTNGWGWSSSTPGLTTSIVGTGVENGLPYIDLRLFGTATSSQSSELGPMGANVVAAAINQTWAASAYMRLVGGTAPGLTISSAIYERDAAASIITSSATFPPLPLTSALMRPSLVRTFTSAGAAFVSMKARIEGFVSGQSYDLTVRLSAPQVERDQVTDPIITTGSAASAGNPFTLVAWAGMNAYSSVTQDVAVVSDGTTSNRVSLRRDPSAQAVVFPITGGANQTAVGTGGKGGVRSLRLAARVGLSAEALSVDGAAVQVATITPPPGMIRLDLGQISGGGGNFLNGYLERVAIFGELANVDLPPLAQAA